MGVLLSCAGGRRYKRLWQMSDAGTEIISLAVLGLTISLLIIQIKQKAVDREFESPNINEAKRQRLKEDFRRQERHKIHVLVAALFLVIVGYGFRLAG